MKSLLKTHSIEDKIDSLNIFDGESWSITPDGKINVQYKSIRQKCDHVLLDQFQFCDPKEKKNVGPTRKFVFHDMKLY